MKSPIKYFGGKTALAKQIITDLFPSRALYVNYVEPFFGSGAMLFEHNFFGKAEVINDLNGTLMSFWRCLQDEEMFSEFVRRVQAIPFSELEWNEAAIYLDTLETQTSLPPIVTEAIAFFICCRQSRSGMMRHFTPLTKTRTRRGMNEQAASWLSAIDSLPEIHERLKRVAVLNRDAISVICDLDSPQTLFYLDPPYPKAVRTGNAQDYLCEMTDEQHQELLENLGHISGKFLLSSYPGQMYDAAAIRFGWNWKDYDTSSHVAGGSAKNYRIERVYYNYL